VDRNTGEFNHIEDVLCRMRTGQWFDWTDPTDRRYENLRIQNPADQSEENKALHGSWPMEKPTKKFLEDKLVEMEAERKAAVQSDTDNKVSAKAKLEELGLTTDEVKAAFGI